MTRQANKELELINRHCLWSTSSVFLVFGIFLLSFKVMFVSISSFVVMAVFLGRGVYFLTKRKEMSSPEKLSWKISTTLFGVAFFVSIINLFYVHAK